MTTIVKPGPPLSPEQIREINARNGIEIMPNGMPRSLNYDPNFAYYDGTSNLPIITRLELAGGTPSQADLDAYMQKPGVQIGYNPLAPTGAPGPQQPTGGPGPLPTGAPPQPASPLLDQFNNQLTQHQQPQQPQSPQTPLMGQLANPQQQMFPRSSPRFGALPPGLQNRPFPGTPPSGGFPGTRPPASPSPLATQLGQPRRTPTNSFGSFGRPLG